MSQLHVVAVVLTVLGGGLGWVTARVLVTGDYRIPEDEASGPAGRGWWPPPVLAIVWGVMTLSVGGFAGWAALPAYLLFGWLSVALVWIDLDVHRLPNGLVLPAYPALGLLLLLASLGAGGRRWQTSLLCALGLWFAFWVLSRLPGGGMGQGDVKLAVLMGAALGWFDVRHVLVGVLFTFLLGGMMAITLLVSGRADRKTRFAFGPAMCVGTLLSVALTGQLAAAMVA